MDKLIDVLNTEKKKLKYDHVLLATSICSDELNHTKELYQLFPSVFQMGGLGGYPHSGITGIDAFLSHVPDNGAAIILYGPHLGINKESQHGLIKRAGQQKDTTSCGALQALLTDHDYTSGNDFHKPDLQNIQYDLLKYKVEQKKIDRLNTNIKQFTYQVYDIMEEDILKMIDRSTLSNYKFPLVLIGGVIINREEGNYLDDVRVDVLNN